jgi:ribosome-associated protein
MLRINHRLRIPLNEIEINYVRSQGAGGQNVNKTATAAHLRFDIQASSLPDVYKHRLLNLPDSRISKDGVIVIKAQQHRSQDQNREDALGRLQEIIKKVIAQPKRRKPTRPTSASRRKRINEKVKRGRRKALRQKIDEY